MCVSFAQIVDIENIDVPPYNCVGGTTDKNGELIQI